jgi:hypothetical protein
MSFAAAQLAIEGRFATGFTHCAIRWQNVAFNPGANQTFAEIQVIDGNAFRASIGPDALHRSTGVISVNIYSPENIGTLTGRVLADAAGDIFRDAIFSKITCRSPVVRNVGSVNGRNVTNMTVAFFRDQQF